MVLDSRFEILAAGVSKITRFEKCLGNESCKLHMEVSYISLRKFYIALLCACKEGNKKDNSPTRFSSRIFMVKQDLYVQFCRTRGSHHR